MLTSLLCAPPTQLSSVCDEQIIHNYICKALPQKIPMHLKLSSQMREAL